MPPHLEKRDYRDELRSGDGGYKLNQSRGGCQMALKEGDRVRLTSMGKDYRVKWIGDRIIVLETEDRTSQYLTTIENVRPLFSSEAEKIKKTLAEERN